jgi:hypothetical protein
MRFIHDMSAAASRPQACPGVRWARRPNGPDRARGGAGVSRRFRGARHGGAGRGAPMHAIVAPIRHQADAGR